MPRRLRYFGALAALAALLFAQAAFALAACEVSSTSLAKMIVAHDVEHADCHQPADNANLCFAHCQSGEQTLDKHQVKVPEAPLLAVAAAPAWRTAARIAPHALRIPPPAAGPPPRILFRTLLI